MVWCVWLPFLLFYTSTLDAGRSFRSTLARPVSKWELAFGPLLQALLAGSMVLIKMRGGFLVDGEVRSAPVLSDAEKRNLHTLLIAHRGSAATKSVPTLRRPAPISPLSQHRRVPSPLMRSLDQFAKAINHTTEGRQRRPSSAAMRPSSARRKSVAFHEQARPSSAIAAVRSSPDGPISRPAPTLFRWNTVRQTAFRKATLLALQRASSNKKERAAAIRGDLQETVSVWDVKGSNLVRSGLLQRPSLVTKASKSNRITQKTLNAAAAFDERHRAAVEEAEQALRLASGSEPTPICRRVKSFNASMTKIRQNRYFETETVHIHVHEDHKIEAPKHLAADIGVADFLWHPRKSLFQARAIGKDVNSFKGFHDTDAKLRACLELDFANALEQRHTRKFICEFGGDADTAIHSVFEVLSKFVFFVYGCFDFYATLGKSDDIFHIRPPAFKRVIADAGLEIPDLEGCKSKDFAALWKLLVSGSADASALNREQWLECLIRFAGMRYRNQDMPTLARALQSLFVNDLLPSVDRRTMADSTAFRNLFVYVQDIDSVLKLWESTLRNTFKNYAFGDGVLSEGSSTELMGFEEWSHLLIDLQLYGHDLTHREVSLSFVWSRMRVVDEQKNSARLSQLSFDEFLEALIHVVAFKAIPLDDEVYESGCEDAGELMLLRLSLPPAERAMLVEAGMRDWDDPLPQPMCTLLEGLLSYMVRFIESVLYGDNGAKNDGKISLAEVKKFKSEMATKREAQRKVLAPFMATIATESSRDQKELSHEEMLRASLFGTASGRGAEVPED